MRTVRGAISFNSPTHLPPSAESRAMKPVMLPPGCERLAAKPPPIGSATVANTIGIVRVPRARALITGVLAPKIASGCSSISSFANVAILSASLAPQRSSIRSRPCSPQQRLPPCCSGRCSLPVRSTCARSMAGRRSPQRPSISQLTSPPETITSCRWRLRHIEFQHKARRHQIIE